MDRRNINTNKKINKKRPKKSNRLVKLFFKVVITIVLLFVIAASGAVFVYNKITGNTAFGLNDSEESSDGGLFSKPKDVELNVAMFGVDKGETRTDVMMVARFESKTGKISMISIPRDTRVSPSSEVRSLLKKNGRSAPDVCKINEIHAYAGKDNGTEASILQLEDLLGIEIDNYAKVNIEAFRELVEAVGGVEFDVPQDMYKDMRDTGDPLINLKKGMQHIDGEKAEQLVRFRGYGNADVGRVAVQQAFLKELLKKVTSTDTIVSNISDYIKIAFKHIQTDFSISDVLKYSKFINKISADNLVTEVLPGEGRYVGGTSYYIHDEFETKKVVDKIFRGIGDDENGSKGLGIEIANGGNVNGLAGKKRQELMDAGYDIRKVSTYTEEQKNETRIIVPKEGMGLDLMQYFTNPVIEVNPEMLEFDIEIKVILGLSEKE